VRELETLKVNEARIQSKELTFDTCHVFNRLELLALLKHYSAAFNATRSHKDRLMVGTVGYPNVGKSSVINVLCGIKRVGVANRPGKTKHF
jgi:ribosome biogenesis GTPase A